MARRRASKAVIISSTASCGPSSAAIPAAWVGAFTQEWQLTQSRTTVSTSASGQTL